ncbi:tRNA (adenosine(37)-N6)-dimethylallyltransferase MiaA [Spongiimicrobium sp. 3-5]|uniref:tRNA (adenosine(37)-N6)-dimethylallyltransferase MiaA n=1 Tax=Spongiimicrobium sp. 3-5 TaxID=3332596 RepID=UPI003980C01D
MKKKILISVVGPTGIGKTSLAIKLAQHFKTEVLSADSRQFYKEMSIGTAVPTLDELNAVPHHFIQHKSILDDYSVGDFERDAMDQLELLFKKKDVVLLVGGSGLYIDAVLKGLDEFPNIDPRVRQDLNKKLEAEGLEALQKQLKELDKVQYKKMDVDNPHRLIRALEVCIGTGKPYSSFLSNTKKSRPFASIIFGLMADREIVYDRINQRVDQMIENGLLEEVNTLKEYRGLNALQTVGYKELFNYIDGGYTLDFAISEIKKNTRRFAKRQGTWFRKNEHIHWINYNSPTNNVIAKVEQQIKDL